MKKRARKFALIGLGMIAAVFVVTLVFSFGAAPKSAFAATGASGVMGFAVIGAAVYSTGYDNDNATPPVKHLPNDGGGRVRLYHDTYLQGDSDGNIGDVIHMKKLPAGARVLAGRLDFGTGNNNETLKCGTAATANEEADDDKFCGATAAATAGSIALDDHLEAGVGYKTTVETEVLVTNGTAAIKAAQRITVDLFYVID